MPPRTDGVLRLSPCLVVWSLYEHRNEVRVVLLDEALNIGFEKRLEPLREREFQVQVFEPLLAGDEIRVGQTLGSLARPGR